MKNRTPAEERAFAKAWKSLPQPTMNEDHREWETRTIEQASQVAFGDNKQRTRKSKQLLWALKSLDFNANFELAHFCWVQKKKTMKSI